MIDYHFHLYFSRKKQTMSCLPMDGMNADNAIKLLDEANIQKAWVFGYPCKKTILENNYVIRESIKYPDRLFPVLLIDKYLDYWFDISNCVAVKEHLYGQKRLYTWNKEWDKVYRQIQNYDVPLIIHLGKDPIRRLSKIKNLAPDIKIIAAHLGWHFEYGLRPRADILETNLIWFYHNNIDVDISSLDMRDIKCVQLAYDILGTERIFWGSDTPTDYITPHIALRNYKNLCNCCTM